MGLFHGFAQELGDASPSLKHQLQRPEAHRAAGQHQLHSQVGTPNYLATYRVLISC